jgi:hypothetical protein
MASEIALWVTVIGTLICAGYAALGYHRPKAAVTSHSVSQPQSLLSWQWIPIICVLLAWGAVGVNYLMRPASSPINILSYGANGDEFFAIVQFRDWRDYEKRKAILIARTVFSDLDRMTDTWIAKSIPYTINAPLIQLTAINKMQMHFAVNTPNLVELSVAVIPPEISADQVRDLADIEHLGGQILGVADVGGIITAQPAAPNAPR